jgi:DNA polymerase III sliding clamp (beta) subunit (PCNA family)
MRATVFSADLLEAVAMAQKVTPTRPSMMAYSAVAITAKGGELTVTGSDGDLTVRARISCESADNGTSLVQPRPLAAWLSTLKEDIVLELEDDGGGDLVVTPKKGSAYRFRTVAASFPSPPKVAGAPHGVDLRELGAALSGVRAAVDRDQRIVQLVSTDEELRVNATDTYRLAQSVVAGGGFGPFTGLVPLGLLEQLPPDTNTVVVDAGGRIIELRSPRAVFTARLAAVAFPAVDSVLEKVPDASMTFDVAEVRLALGRLATIIDHEPLHVRVHDGRVTFSVPSSPVGSGAESVVVTGADGVEFEFAVNLGFLSDALAGRGGTTVEMRFSAPTAPLFFVTTGKVRVTSVVMPVRI